MLYLRVPIVLPHSVSHATTYARLTPPQAAVVLALIALLFVGAIAVTLSPLASTNITGHEHETGDVALYRAEVDRIRDGEGYYQAAAAELTARGYPTRSVFNWRTPLPVWLLGKLPAVVLGKIVLGALALAAMLLAFAALGREEDEERSRGHWWAGARCAGLSHPTHNATRKHLATIACVLLLSGSLLPTVLSDFFVMPVLWAGVLIALSAGAYGDDRARLGFTCGLAAVFFRELALPYCLVCAGMALWQGRRREVACWIVGLAAWALFYSIHCWEVSTLITHASRAHREGWIQFGAAGFVISTAQMNAYLLLLPQWVTGVYLVAAMVGLAGWNTPLGTRIGLTTCVYLAAFAVVGQSFNQYWGCLIAPLLCFGVSRFPAAAFDLWTNATKRSSAAYRRDAQCAD